jgi:hypothetical protein
LETRKCFHNNSTALSNFKEIVPQELHILLKARLSKCSVSMIKQNLGESVMDEVALREILLKLWTMLD